MWMTYCTGFKPNGSIWDMGAQVFQKSMSHFIFHELTSHRKSMQTKMQYLQTGICQYRFREARDFYNK